MTRKPRPRRRSPSPTPSTERRRHHFDVGSPVEVRSREIQLQGAWFEATITRNLSRSRSYIVSYSSLIADDASSHLLKQERVYRSHVRPRPPPGDPSAVFGLHQCVEALHNGGWRKGAVRRLPERDGDGSYLVCFPGTRDEFRFKAVEIRWRMEWVNGEWILVEEGDQDSRQHAQEEMKQRKRGRTSKKQVAYMNGIEYKQLDGRNNIVVGDKEGMKFVEPSNQTLTIQQLPVLEPFDHMAVGTEDEAQKQGRPSMENEIHIYDKLIHTETESGVEMGRSPIDHMPTGLALVKEHNVCGQVDSTESVSPRETATVGIEDRAPLDHIPCRSSLHREDYVHDHEGSTRDEPLLKKNVFAMERAPSDPTPSGSSPPEVVTRGHEELIPSALPLEKAIVEADGRDEIDSSTSRSFCIKAAFPFIKESAMWEIIESMEAFHRMPQQPHFHPLKQYDAKFREGMAIGLMATFAALVDSIQKLQLTDSQDIFQEKMNALVPLELNGFNVHSVRSRLEILLEIRIIASQSDDKKLSLKEKLMETTDMRDRFYASLAAQDKIIMELEETLCRYREKRALILSGRDQKDSEIVQLKMDLQATEEACNSAEEHFNAVINAPWEMQDDYVHAGIQKLVSELGKRWNQ